MNFHIIYDAKITHFYGHSIYCLYIIKGYWPSR